METKKKSVAELEQELAVAKANESAQQQKQKLAYEDLKSETIINLCTKAIELNNSLKIFKTDAFDSMQTIWAMLQEYSSRHADGKGNFRIEFEGMRVSYKRQGKASFDERSHQAEKHIIDFVNSKFENDADVRDLIMSLLERKKGELDIQLIQKLYAMENRFLDKNWKRGIELLKESYSYSHSKDYIAFEQQDANGQWNAINLQFSNV
ncbi:DUF3164 family protein [Flavobacterium sp. LS1R47]|uniref:DUF3164 family protein n=1 Tax=Flavobacterium frigoritolerans TaxID=2987686 RepID=A0A9X3HNB9_9FLAO|nr:DUF3164 family protein [Flavobacterium frigoritolerans]MCV9934520.1 DUF3164 family protein [Flavobacterium frigoritolerans]